MDLLVTSFQNSLANFVKLLQDSPWLFVEGCGVPLILILIGSFMRRLARGPGWKLEDFFFGGELSLASIAGTLTLLINSQGINTDIANRVGFFLVITLCAVFLIISLDQDFRVGSNRDKIVWLLGVSNIIGIILMFIFVAWIQINEVT